MKRRITGFLLALVMMVTSVIGYGPVEASITSGDIRVDSITFRKVHTGYEINGAYIEVWGENLDQGIVLFEHIVDGFREDMGVVEIKTSGLLRYTFSKEEAINFGSRIAVDGKQIDLGLTTYPNFTDADKKVYNLDDGDQIVLQGAYLDKIANAEVVATYSRSGATPIVYDPVNDSPTQITIEDVLVTGGILGEQTLSIESNSTETVGAETYEKRVVYVYNNALSLIEDLNVTNPNLYPNTGAKGDEFYIEADDLDATRNYRIYFTTEVGESLSAANQADFVSLTIDAEGTTDRLIFRVPDRPDFKELEYTLILTDTKNDSVIARQTLDDTFSVVDASYLPTIEEIYPTEGPQEGADIQVDGRNLISLNLADLATKGVVDTITQNMGTLSIDYQDALYDGKNVSINKEIVMKVGSVASYLVDGSGDIRYSQGIIDSLFVRAPQADDAETDPFKDVNIEIKITLTGADFEYVFKQVVNAPDAFKFIPSSITPTVDSIVPSTMHVVGSPGDFFTGDDMMLVIDGGNFLVNRYTDSSGKVFINYPQVLIKTVNDQSLASYDIHINPNGEAAGVHGLIYDMSDTIASGNNYMKNTDGTPYKLDFKVVDNSGREVTGTANNDVGTRIIARIPRNAEIEVADFKNVLVVNPTRNSQEAGKKLMTVEGMQFVETNDIPIIESVTPSVVTVEGNEEVVILGNNFQEGVKLWLDGREITTFTREITTSGNKIILKFTAPPGPAGKSQVVVQNPSGALATQDFYYVTSFNKDPVITDFVPAKGTAETYVVINGENFLKEDPTAETLSGLDSLRMIGTRVFLDGKDVNDYNADIEGNITFDPYQVPDVVSFMEPDHSNKRIDMTPFEENIYIKDASDVYYFLSNDGDGNPVITDNLGTNYVFKYVTDGIYIYDIDDTLLGPLAGNYSFTPDADPKKGLSEIVVDGKTLSIHMNNHILSKKKAPGNVEVPALADYGESVVLTSDGTAEEYFRLYKDYDNSIMLSNGKDQTYEILVESNQLVARISESQVVTISDVTEDGFKVNDVPAFTVTMTTPYKSDSSNKIVGQRAKVLNRGQVAFTVPELTTGRGYKDLRVVNPDTKYDERLEEEGFYYIAQAASHPRITSVNPNEGSIDGGYSVRIEGKYFEDSMSVYIDGVLVPPEETTVASDRNSVVITMPKLQKDLAGDYDVSSLEVSVVVLNNDGGNDARPRGFKYIIPTSQPEIDFIQPKKGTTNGGTIVEIIGYEFRFFEPYKNLVGDQGYDVGDEIIDLYKDGIWNDLLHESSPPGAVVAHPIVPAHPYYTEYFVSPILPKVFFGDLEAKVVEYDNGYLKVISPQSAPGIVDVYVVNNDSGVSNKVPYTYEASTPVISQINPAFGKKQGQELRDFYGTGFYQGIYKGYQDNDPNAIVTLDNLDSSIRFSDIHNMDIPRGDLNSGLINAERTTVQLTGDLRTEYNGSANTLTLSVVENNKIYTRTFNNYNDEEIYIPMEMLQTSANEFYHPTSTPADVHDGTSYKGLIFEYIRVSIDNKRLFVERSYAPKVDYDNSSHMVVTTPSYYTVESVPVQMTNPDFGVAKSSFQYTYPASEPKIFQVGPRQISPDGSKWYTKRSVKGGTQIEVLGLDFRDDVKAYIGSTPVVISEKSLIVEQVDGVDQTFDILIIDVPQGNLNEVGIEQPIIITNTDYGVANSSNAIDIYGTDKKPMFFVYQRPLSDPTIEEVRPEETSQFGGHTVTLVGRDFRTGATVTIGSAGGVPITNTTITERGTILTFTTPANTLLPGDKAIQVQNEDFGTSGMDKKIKIVSYPVVNTDITFENGLPVNWVSVEGGTKIVITGENFYDGMKVYIGGERSEGQGNVTGVTGLFKDDKYYTLADGNLATEVEVVSENKAIVTTPTIPLENPYAITAVNSDGGISDGIATVLYSVPVPSKPVGLKLELIDNRYIRISDYTASDHKYYEIYYFVGSKTTQNIMTDNYTDMRYLDSTDLEPYRLPSINAVENMRASHQLVIGLKAVNKFGSSDWSNLAVLSYQELKDVKELGDPNIDGGIGVPDGKDYMYEIIGTELVTTISSKPLPPSLYIDLSTPNYASVKEHVINVPGVQVLSSSSLIRVDYDKVDIQFTPLTLNTAGFRAINGKGDAYGIIATSSIEDAYSGYMLNQIPRGFQAVSTVVTIGFDAKNNDSAASLDGLNGAMNMVLNYDSRLLIGKEPASIGLYRFDKISNQWTKLTASLDQANTRVTGQIDQAGAYVILIRK